MCTSLRFLPSSTTRDVQNVAVVASSSGRLWHWHATSGKCLGPRGGAPIVEDNENQIYALDVRGDGGSFATAGFDGAVRVYDETTQKLSATLTGGGDDGLYNNSYRGNPGVESSIPGGGGGGGGAGGHTNRVFGVAYASKNRNVLVSGGWDNTLQIWDERCGGGAVRSIFGPHVCGDAIDIAGVDGGGEEIEGGGGTTEILTGSWRDNNALQVWDMGTGRLIQDVPFGALPGERNCQLYAVGTLL